MGDSECMDLTHSVHTFHPYLRGAHVVTKNRRLHYQTSPVDRRELQQCNTHPRTALPTTRETLPSVFLGYVSQTISLISERVHVFANRPQQRLTLLSALVARCTILIRESTIVRGFFPKRRLLPRRNSIKTSLYDMHPKRVASEAERRTFLVLDLCSDTSKRKFKSFSFCCQFYHGVHVWHNVW